MNKSMKKNRVSILPANQTVPLRFDSKQPKLGFYPLFSMTLKFSIDSPLEKMSRRRLSHYFKDENSQLPLIREKRIKSLIQK